jgi:hypothetical protein
VKDANNYWALTPNVGLVSSINKSVANYTRAFIAISPNTVYVDMPNTEAIITLGGGDDLKSYVDEKDQELLRQIEEIRMTIKSLLS